MFKFSATAIVLAAAILSTAAPAQDTPTQVRVTFDTRDIGTARFARRIETGIRRVCGPQHFGSGLAALKASHECRDDLRRDARVKVAALENRASTVKLASVR